MSFQLHSLQSMSREVLLKMLPPLMCGTMTYHPFSIKCFQRKVVTAWSIRSFLLYAYVHFFPHKVEEMAGVFREEQEEEEDEEEEEEEEGETEEQNWDWEEEEEWILD